MFGDEMDFEDAMIDHQFLTGGEDVNWGEFPDHEYQEVEDER